MYRLTTVAVAIGLACPAFGQASPAFTTPPGYLTTEGTQLGGTSTTGYAYYFGGYSDGRFQQADGEIKALGVQILNSVGYRLDYLSHSSTTGGGRSWSNVTLSLADCDFTKVTNNFGNNALSTPMVVHNAAVSWPTQTGNPSSRPAPWDKMLQFPFKGVYPYTARADLLLDFAFQGGTLANALTWGTNSLRTYYLDGFYWVTAVTFGRNVYRTNSNTCNDSAWTHTTYASSAVQVGLYSKLSTSYPDTAQLQVFGNATAPNAPIIKAFNLMGLAPLGVGIPIGANCNNLMIETKNAVFQTYTTDGSGNHNPWTYIKLGSLAKAQTYGTAEIWCQGAWTDSKTGAFSLTSCERCRPTWNYAILNDTNLIPKKLMVYYYNTTNTTGSGPYNYYYLNPITRYN